MPCDSFSNGSNSAITINAGTLESGFCHRTWQETFEAFVAAMSANLPSNFAGFVIGSDTPSAADQDKLWARVNDNCTPFSGQTTWPPVTGSGFYVWSTTYGEWRRFIPHQLMPGCIVDFTNATFAGKTTEEIKALVLLLDGGSDVDPFWRLCDGTNGTPDLQGRCRIGIGSRNKSDGTPTTYIYDASGGQVDVNLQIDELPAHSHTVPTGTVGGTTGISVSTTAPTPHTFTTNETGGSVAHNNMQPYYACVPIMRTTRMY